MLFLTEKLQTISRVWDILLFFRGAQPNLGLGRHHSWGF